MFLLSFKSFYDILDQIGYFFPHNKTVNFKKYPVCEYDGKVLRQQMNICVRLIQYVQVNSVKSII